MKTSPAQIRHRLVDALQLDLVGPLPDDQTHAEEVLPESASHFYLTGFLVPAEAPVAERSDDDGDDQLELFDRPGQDDDQPTEATSARKSFFPSSMGLSVLVARSVEELQVHVTWGDYEPFSIPTPAEREASTGEAARPSLRGQWKRQPRAAELPLPLKGGSHVMAIPRSEGLELAIAVQKVSQPGSVPPGTRSVAVFLVNRRKPNPGLRDTAFAFQASLRVTSPEPFVPRPDVRGKDGEEWDEQVADLQYHDVMEFAVGHNVSARAERDTDGQCRAVSTTWIPTAEVEKVVPGQVKGLELRMEELASSTSSADLQRRLAPLVSEYRSWIEQQANVPFAEKGREAVAQELTRSAQLASDRLEAGIAALEDPHIFDAFCVANRAIAAAIRQRNAFGTERRPADLPPPGWYPFQLAFLLMNLTGLSNPTHRDREVVDLLFFPTGGGKTEAYLGLAAFTLVLRRLRNPGIQSAGLSVLMRYTLRLLTLDQLGRAATLICALELERRKDVTRLGPWPFEIGLWVGEGATPNRMGTKGDGLSNTARARTIAYMGNSDRNPPPLPLEKCPWCGVHFTPKSFELRPNPDTPRDLMVRCSSRACTFSGDPWLPIVAVDEPLYRRLPCFMISTVDKFASLPWVGETGQFFGKVERYDQEGFYGAMELGRGRSLQGGLLPPDLIIQDELHLISGPLGTIVGHYETALDALSTRDVDGKKVRAKIVASTATVRRAARQIRALFARSEVDIFPPPGPNRRDSFFALTAPAMRTEGGLEPPASSSSSPVKTDAKHPRLYVGVAALGRNPKVVLLRTYLALLGAAQKQWLAQGGNRNTQNSADAYMTLLGYFNSLRELGGSRRIVEDEVNSRLSQYAGRKRLYEQTGLFANRQIDDLPEELTSRVSTSQVAKTKERLSSGFHEESRVDVALATNMISVGLDIVRLGLMVVLGQPKTAAEYIQATSRVGRDENRPGLVVTLLNVHRPRDRSHYERFESWHASFYRAVEATSATPFSPRAIDRALAAITVTLARHGLRELTAPSRALGILQARQKLEAVADVISQRAEYHDKELDAAEAERLRKKVKARVQDLLDVWESLAHESHKSGSGFQYQREVSGNSHLLYAPLDPELDLIKPAARKFKAARSMRDVEPEVNIWVKNPHGLSVENQGDEV